MGRKIKDLTGQKFGRLIAIKDSGKRSSGLVVWECLCDCGNTTFVIGNDLRSGSTRSCGCLRQEIRIKENQKRIGNKHPMYGKTHTKETRQKMSEAQSGEKHASWKGGISPERNRIMQLIEYKEWRKAIYERDNYICQKCDQKGGNLNAHHIEAYNNNPELRTNIDNGITLCVDCHKEFHHQYGYKCTKNNLDIFLEIKEN